MLYGVNLFLFLFSSALTVNRVSVKSMILRNNHTVRKYDKEDTRFVL